MRNLGLYVNIPFCKSKCFYCDFPSFKGYDHMMDIYIKALIKEAYLYRDIEFDTVFIGGGTPSYLPENLLKELLKVFYVINISKDCEFTIEVNPGTLSVEKMKLIKDMGVNRISFGLQSANDEILKQIGRIHTFNDFEKSYSLARKYEIKNINIDIIYGLPYGELKDLKDTVNYIMKLEPEHISAYSFILEENTKFMDMYNKGNLKLKDEDLEFYEKESIYNMLMDNDYMRYEISNFAKKNFSSKHNLKYWNLEEYIGIGSASHSYYEGIRFNNVVSIEEYIRKMDEENSAIENSHMNTLNENIEEFVMLGLRKIEGISLNRFKEKFKRSFFDIYHEEFKKWEDKGLLRLDEEHIKFTDRGLDLSNIVLKDFLF